MTPPSPPSPPEGERPPQGSPQSSGACGDPPALPTPHRLHLHRHECDAFFSLLEDTVVQDFLSTDVCCRVSDKYLLAMALTYFKRAGLPTSEYTPVNLFAALYLASDMEEDEEEPKLLLLSGALGHRWRRERLLPRLLRHRDRLWARMSYRAAVSRHCCEEVMAAEPLHWAWGRERAPPHSGAARAPSCPRCARHPPGEEEEEEEEEGAGAAPAPRRPLALIWGKTRRNRGCPTPDLGEKPMELGPPHTR